MYKMNIIEDINEWRSAGQDSAIFDSSQSPYIHTCTHTGLLPFNGPWQVFVSLKLQLVSHQTRKFQMMSYIVISEL